MAEYGWDERLEASDNIATRTSLIFPQEIYRPSFFS
jgi:hypothetical protein